MSDSIQIDIEYCNLDKDAKWMVDFEGKTKFFKDWNSMIAYLIQIRNVKGLS